MKKIFMVGKVKGTKQEELKSEDRQLTLLNGEDRLDFKKT